MPHIKNKSQLPPATLSRDPPSAAAFVFFYRIVDHAVPTDATDADEVTANNDDVQTTKKEEVEEEAGWRHRQGKLPPCVIGVDGWRAGGGMGGIVVATVVQPWGAAMLGGEGDRSKTMTITGGEALSSLPWHCVVEVACVGGGGTQQST